MKWIFYSLLILSSFSFLSCSNVLLPAATTTDDSLLVDAQIAIDSHDYSTAINKFALMSSTYTAQRSVKAMYASAYAGRCGLDLITLTNTFSSLGSTTFMKALYNNSVSASSSNENDCISAANLVIGISSSSSSRTSAENLLLAMIELKLMGVLLARYGDQNKDGTIDSAFDPCTQTVATYPAASGMPVAEAQQFFASLMVAKDAISAANISTFSSFTSSITTACTAIKALSSVIPSIGDPCSQTTASSFTHAQLQGLIALITSNSTGIGSCSDTTYVTCMCASYP